MTDHLNDTNAMADQIATILRENIRLVGSAEHQCDECEGPWSYRVKEGNIEHCAQLIAALHTDQPTLPMGEKR
jgi:hypothetical protein